MTLPLIQIYDTTLRDGTQSEGFNLSANDKVRVAQKLDEFGVSFIEGGWPGSNKTTVTNAVPNRTAGVSSTRKSAAATIKAATASGWSKARAR